MVAQGFFSPDKKTRMAGERENKSEFSVKVEPVRVANNINQYNEQTPSLDYAPDRVGDYIRDTKIKSYRDDRSEDEKFQDLVKERFTREDGGVFKDENEFDRKMINYYTDRDGNPAAVDAFGERVYDTDKIKRYIAADAKEKYQNEQQQKLNQGLAALKAQNQQIDDFNYYKSNLDFNEKGEPDPANKYVLTASEMRERMKDLGVNETMDKYGIIRPYKQQVQTEDTRKLGTMPSMGISEAGRTEAKLNRLEKAKQESNLQDSRNIFQKVGDAVGNVFNTITGTQPAGAQGINTSATVNIAQMGNVDPVTQASRDVVARSNLRRSGLDKTIGGQSSQANYGRASKGFGTGTHGKGMPSNPGSQRQTGVGVSASNLSRHKAGSSAGRRGTTGSKSTSRGTAGSRSRGGTGTGRSSQGSKSSARGARGGTSSRSRGGTGSGRTSTSRSASKASKSRTGRSRTRCDIRTKIDISPLINSNLVKDNLSELAYFVQELKK